MKLLRRPFQQKKQRPTAYSLVDIGCDTVKVAVALVKPEAAEVQIIGVGQAETSGHNISGGRLEANAVTAPVNAALTQAEDSTEKVLGHKIVPDDVIFALTSRASTGQLFSVGQTRPKPMEPVTAKELTTLRNKAERLVRQGLANLSVEGGQWQALAVTDAGLRLDNRLALEGVGLTGREITFSAFGVAAQAGALRALRVLANRLDLELTNVVAASQAVAAAVPYAEAVILDNGSTGTDICLIQDNALIAAGSVPFGGVFFTQALSQALELEPAEAEKLKRAFATGTLPPAEVIRVETCLEGARYRWLEAVMEFLVKAAEGKLLPRNVYLIGGGNLLPGLDKLLRATPEPFQSAPEVSWLGPQAFPTIKDLTQAMDYRLFALTLSLSVGIPDDV